MRRTPHPRKNCRNPIKASLATTGSSLFGNMLSLCCYERLAGVTHFLVKEFTFADNLELLKKC